MMSLALPWQSGKQKDNNPPEWAQALITGLAVEKQARIEQGKEIHRLGELIADQQKEHKAEIARLEMAHRDEIARIERSHADKREQLIERIGEQNAHIDSLRRAAENETRAGIDRHESIGFLTKGLQDAETRLTDQRRLSDAWKEEMKARLDRADRDMRYLLTEFAELDAERIAADPTARSRLATVRSLIEIKTPNPPETPHG